MVNPLSNAPDDTSEARNGDSNDTNAEETEGAEADAQSTPEPPDTSSEPFVSQDGRVSRESLDEPRESPFVDIDPNRFEEVTADGAPPRSNEPGDDTLSASRVETTSEVVDVLSLGGLTSTGVGGHPPAEGLVNPLSSAPDEMSGAQSDGDGDGQSDPNETESHNPDPQSLSETPATTSSDPFVSSDGRLSRESLDDPSEDPFADFDADRFQEVTAGTPPGSFGTGATNEASANSSHDPGPNDQSEADPSGTEDNESSALDSPTAEDLQDPLTDPFTDSYTTDEALFDPQVYEETQLVESFPEPDVTDLLDGS